MSGQTFLYGLCKGIELKVSIQWEEGASFRAETESGHVLRMDGPPDAGGRDTGPRPMEAILMGTGACSGFHVVHILRKARQDIVSCTVDMDAERATTDPQVFTRIHIHFVITGRNLRQAQVQRAVDLSAEKYCSASIMLSKAVEITHDFELREPQPDQCLVSG